MEGNAIKDELAAIRQELVYITHGNGRRGLWAISDAVFGAKDRPDEPGLVSRVKAIEERHKESRFLTRGIAIGVGLLTVDKVVGLDLVAIVTSFFAR